MSDPANNNNISERQRIRQSQKAWKYIRDVNGNSLVYLTDANPSTSTLKTDIPDR